MKWEKELILSSSNQEEYNQAIQNTLENFSNKLKILFDNYNKINSLLYGKNIRANVHKLEDKKTELIDFAFGLKYSVENKALVVERFESIFNEVEHLNEKIIEVHEKNIETPLDLQTQISNITTQIKSIQKELNALSHQRNDILNSKLFIDYESKLPPPEVVALRKTTL